MNKVIGTVVLGLSLVSTGYASPTSPAVVAGSNLRGFVLGMTRQQVLAMAPNPFINSSSSVVYENPVTGNRLAIRMEQETGTAICYTSQDFDTAEGIRVTNYDDPKYAHLFTVRQTDSGKIWEYKSGGLSFFISTEISKRVGCILSVQQYGAVVTKPVYVAPKQQVVAKPVQKNIVTDSSGPKTPDEALASLRKCEYTDAQDAMNDMGWIAIGTGLSDLLLGDNSLERDKPYIERLFTACVIKIGLVYLSHK